MRWCLTVPAWMFDRAVCVRVRRAEGPRVELAALVRLRTLLAEVANRASVAAVIEARHCFDHRGDADAAPESSATNCPTRSVPLAESTKAQLARPVGRGAGESDASHRADAEPARARQSSTHKVIHNRDGRSLQYAVRERLAVLGWPEID